MKTTLTEAIAFINNASKEDRQILTSVLNERWEDDRNQAKKVCMLVLQ